MTLWQVQSVSIKPNTVLQWGNTVASGLSFSTWSRPPNRCCILWRQFLLNRDEWNLGCQPSSSVKSPWKGRGTSQRHVHKICWAIASRTYAHEYFGLLIIYWYIYSMVIIREVFPARACACFGASNTEDWTSAEECLYVAGYDAKIPRLAKILA